MRLEFINPFVTAAYEVLAKELDAQVERGKITLQKSAYTTQDVTTLIGVAGKVQGNVLYGMSVLTAKDMVSRMMGGEVIEELDEMALSAIGEIGNVVTGRASVLLANAGFPSQISPPTIIMGNNIQISTLDVQRLVVPLSTQFGTLEIHIALREGVGVD